MTHKTSTEQRITELEEQVAELMKRAERLEAEVFRYRSPANKRERLEASGDAETVIDFVKSRPVWGVHQLREALEDLADAGLIQMETPNLVAVTPTATGRFLTSLGYNERTKSQIDKDTIRYDPSQIRLLAAHRYYNSSNKD